MGTCTLESPSLPLKKALGVPFHRSPQPLSFARRSPANGYGNPSTFFRSYAFAQLSWFYIRNVSVTSPLRYPPSSQISSQTPISTYDANLAASEACLDRQSHAASRIFQQLSSVFVLLRGHRLNRLRRVLDGRTPKYVCGRVSVVNNRRRPATQIPWDLKDDSVGTRNTTPVTMFQVIF